MTTTTMTTIRICRMANEVFEAEILHSGTEIPSRSERKGVQKAGPGKCEEGMSSMRHAKFGGLQCHF